MGLAGGEWPSDRGRIATAVDPQGEATCGAEAASRTRANLIAREALQRSVSLVLVTRTQVQPVSLQTLSSRAPGAP
jgi:hypothetical protein